LERSENQKELIHNTNWDILLVIDACRYDYFQKYYKDILVGGSLQKAITSTTFTFGWIMNNFGEGFDATFICTEPITDSIHDVSNKIKHGNTIDVSKYFKWVLDVYTEGWVEPGLIYPETVNQALRYHLDRSGHRVVVKFIQIHDPYIYWLKRGFVSGEYKQKIKGNLRKVLYEVISDETYWNVCKKLGFPPENWLNHLWLEHGKGGIVKGYCEDLLMMLKLCKGIIDDYPDRNVVITSDHGERLGEGGRYSHGGKRTKVIKEVPWYEVRRH